MYDVDCAAALEVLSIDPFALYDREFIAAFEAEDAAASAPAAPTAAATSSEAKESIGEKICNWFKNCVAWWKKTVVGLVRSITTFFRKKVMQHRLKVAEKKLKKAEETRSKLNQAMTKNNAGTLGYLDPTSMKVSPKAYRAIKGLSEDAKIPSGDGIAISLDDIKSGMQNLQSQANDAMKCLDDTRKEVDEAGTQAYKAAVKSAKRVNTMLRANIRALDALNKRMKASTGDVKKEDKNAF